MLDRCIFRSSSKELAASKGWLSAACKAGPAQRKLSALWLVPDKGSLNLPTAIFWARPFLLLCQHRKQLLEETATSA